MPLKELRIHELPCILATERRATASAPPFYRTAHAGPWVVRTGGTLLHRLLWREGANFGAVPRVKLVTASEVKVF